MDQRLYDYVHSVARDGDNALFACDGLVGRTGYAEWSHVGKLYWYRRTLMLAECREFVGGRTVTLLSQVQEYPGQIDIVRPRCSAEVAAEGAEMVVRQAGHPYGWGRIYWLGLMRLAGFRALTRWRADVHDQSWPSWDELKVCSETVIFGERLGAYNLNDDFYPIPELGTRWVLPEHIGLATGPIHGDYEPIARRIVERKAA